MLVVACYIISSSGFFRNEWRVLKIMTFGKGVLVSWSAHNQDETALGSTTFRTCWIRIVHSDSIESLEVQLPIHQKPDESRVSLTKIRVVVFGLVSTYLPHSTFSCCRTLPHLEQKLHLCPCSMNHTYLESKKQVSFNINFKEMFSSSKPTDSWLILLIASTH